MRETVNALKEQLPQSYEEAFNNPDPKLRSFWREAIKKEVTSLEKIRNVWRRIQKTQMPKGRRCVKSKWVFDIKRSGLFKVRLVACGYSQVPGVDFTESYAPVIHDVSWRMLVVIMMVNKYDAKIVNVETAFLYGDLEEEVYMTCPEIHGPDEVLELLHSIYGLVQAARQYYKKFISVLKKIGFKGGYPDPCLLTRKNESGVVYIAIWVDDLLMVGDTKAINQAIEDLQKQGFTLFGSPNFVRHKQNSM